MLDVLNFVFQSFWVWLGTVVLLAVLVTPITTAFTVLAALCGGKKG